jgi:hypothetical protein
MQNSTTRGTYRSVKRDGLGRPHSGNSVPVRNAIRIRARLHNQANVSCILEPLRTPLHPINIIAQVSDKEHGQDEEYSVFPPRLFKAHTSHLPGDRPKQDVQQHPTTSIHMQLRPSFLSNSMPLLQPLCRTTSLVPRSINHSRPTHLAPIHHAP